MDTIRLRIMTGLLVGLGLAAPAFGQPACSTYINDYTPTGRAAFAFGYLEGVQAALTKEVADILVPPSDRDHPVWWVVPGGAANIEKFAELLFDMCKTQSNSEILKAILSAVLRKDGWPKFGVWLDKDSGKHKRDDTYKQILGESSLTCKMYNQLDQAAREALIAGYFNGTEAYRIALKHKPDVPWMAWPLGISSPELKSRVDKAASIARNP
jgi:hypothetical protein